MAAMTDHGPWAALRLWRAVCLWSVLLVLLVAPLAAQQRLSARLSADRVVLGQTVELHIDAGAQGALPDLSALDADFHVRGLRQERQSVVQQGRFLALTSHVVVLQPRHAGLLTVPVLQVGTAQTAALTLQVLPAPGSQDSGLAGGALPQVSARLSSDHAWVGQPVRLSVTVLLDDSIATGELLQDAPAGAQLQRDGRDDSQQVLHQGQPAMAITRHYLLTAEQPGQLTLPPARFVAQPVRGLWSGSGQALGYDGPALGLDVRPLPETADTPWLPLDGLALHWLPGPSVVTAGQGARFTLEAVLEGAASVPPDLFDLPAAGPDWRLYAEPMAIERRTVDGKQVQQVRRDYLLVARSPGSLRLPDVSLAWWQAADGQRHVSHAAGPAVTVQPASAAGGAAMGGGDGPVAPDDRARLSGESAGRTRWVLAAIALGLAVGLVGYGRLRWRRRRNVAADASAAMTTAGGLSPALSRALEQGSVQEVIDVLCGEAGVSGRRALLAALADPSQRHALQMAERAWWIPGGNRVAARTVLRAAFAHGPRWHPNAAVAPADPLQPLYPPHRP